jgi:hypothetical protein
MAAPTGTIRTAVEARLITELFPGVEGFATTAVEGSFLVTAPYQGTAPHNRVCVVGAAADPTTEPTGMARGRSPQSDGWSILCGLGCTDQIDPLAAKALLEDGFNALADAIAADHRLGMYGPRDAMAILEDGPYFSWIETPGPDGPVLVPTGWLDFRIDVFADFVRNPAP